ncbi:hypothetical protein [Sphaerospermopsis reniformis]|uniref:hypothetical protein n=1 Tax=Sphaerospermopsis reniformis TaxID=531300 RepID=UPI00139696EA|nr:hypothetical protein [Sphaerospermopsis reniformis]
MIGKHQIDYSVTSYQSPVTSHQLPVTSHLTPIRSHHFQSTIPHTTLHIHTSAINFF